MKRQCDVCRALIYKVGDWPHCLLGKEIGMRVIENPDGSAGTSYPAPGGECPKPITRKAFEEEIAKMIARKEAISKG